MNSNRNNKAQLAAVLALLVIPQTGANCIARSGPKSGNGAKQPALNANELPFDKLELFSFFAAGPVPLYAKQIVQDRGTDFTPDADFVSSFSAEAQRDILRGIRPRSAHKAAPDRDRAYDFARSAYQEQQQHLYANATGGYQKALKLAPESATLHLAFAAELLFARDFPQGDEQIQASIQLWPENAEAHGMLALSMVLQKRSAEAETESRETLKLFPRHVSARFLLAQALTNEHKYKEAIPAIREAMVAMPSMIALTKFLGIALMETGDITSGIEKLSAYLKLSPDDAEGHYFLGVALRANGDSAGAHVQFAEAVRLKPKDPRYQVAANPEAELSQEASGSPKPEDSAFGAGEYSNRFFGLAYSVPAGWRILSPLSAGTAIENLKAHAVSEGLGDADIRKIEDKLVFTLLYAVNGPSGVKPGSAKSVIVTAIDARFEDDVTTASYADSVMRRIRKGGFQGETRGIPVEVTVGGRKFWKAGFVVRNGSLTRYGSEFVTESKGYFLVFTFGAPDLGNLGEIEKSLDSVQFQPSAK